MKSSIPQYRQIRQAALDVQGQITQSLGGVRLQGFLTVHLGTNTPKELVLVALDELPWEPVANDRKDLAFTEAHAPALRAAGFAVTRIRICERFKAGAAYELQPVEGLQAEGFYLKGADGLELAELVKVRKPYQKPRKTDRRTLAKLAKASS